MHHGHRAGRIPATAALLLLAAIVAGSCVRQRDIFAPMPGAVQRTIPDTSVSVVLDAATQAITDRGLSIGQVDREHGMVESEYVDIAAIRSDIDAATAAGIERNVRFRFRAIPSFGAVSVYGEAVYQLGDFGGRASERMVPEEHPARPVLEEMLESIQDQAAHAKAEREPVPPAS